jgi:parallel beta-helix repeat protein
MENKQNKTKGVATILVFACLLAFCIYATAGSLQPSAPLGSTMKTLDEVEPRIPITQADIPLTITQKGSYYFTGDLTATATAITVEANDVTIDLMGYSLTGPGTGTTFGIYMHTRNNVEIRNGTVRSFGRFGILEENLEGSAHRVINVRVLENGIVDLPSSGIRLRGKGHLVKDCTAAHNYGDGISVEDGCTVTGNTAYNNQNHGIHIDAGATVTGNIAYSNQGNGINTPGVCVITNNTAYANQVDGIYAGSTSTVTNNVATANNQDDSSSNGGIRVYYGCIVKGNTLKGNKQNNIYVTMSDNAIEENLVTGSSLGNGIYFNQTGNFYANNRASGNGTNYAGNVPTGYGDGGGNVSF